MVMAPDASFAQIPGGAVVLVLPLDHSSGDQQTEWLREGMAVLLTDVLAAAGVTVVARDDRVLALERLQVPAGVALSRASAIRVGHVVGATLVVGGRVTLDGDRLSCALRPVRLDEGRLLPEVTETGTVRELFPLAHRLGRSLIGAGDRAVDWHPPPSLAAFESYARALMAESPAAQTRLLDAAIAAAPGFTAARLALWRLHSEQGNHQRAWEAAGGPAVPPTGDADLRFAAALSLSGLGRHDDALAALRALQATSPRAPVANAIGVVMLRRGVVQGAGSATYYFHQAAQLDPGDADYFFNLGHAYWLAKDAAAATYWLREAVRRDPADADAHFVLSAALHSSGATAEALRERSLADQLSSRYESLEATTAGGDAVPRGLERLRDRLAPGAPRVDALLTSETQRDQASLARFYLDAGRRAVERDADAEALRELRRATFLAPYLAEAHVLLGRLHLRGGRVDEAIEAGKIALWSDQTVEAHLLLAEAYVAADNSIAAASEVDRALALDPASTAAREMRAKLRAP
jgi:tetratricopeptide (TPR) repeat protein/TolB-like protein